MTRITRMEMNHPRNPRHPRLPECGLSLPILLALDTRTKGLFEEAFLHQTINNAVINDLVKIGAFQLSLCLGVCLLADRLDRVCHHIGYTLKSVRFRELIVHSTNIRGILFVV